ncbi:MAG: hypothetical protein WB643_02685 [Candidatus Bathyarchaeia archaeon]
MQVLVWGGLFAVLVVVLVLPLAATQTCYSNYQLTAASSDYYSLVGVTGQFANGTAATVTGYLAPYNGTGHYRGVIYVQLLQTSSITNSYYSMTVVEISGNSTQTYTNPSSHPPGLQQVTVAGSITSFQVCVRPVPEFNQGTACLLEVTAILLALFLVTSGAFRWRSAERPRRRNENG